MAAKIFLICLLFIPALVLAGGKVNRLTHKNAIAGEYLAILKNIPDVATAARFAELVNQVPGTSLKRQYMIGNKRLALIRAPDQALVKLSEIPFIEFLESNQRVHIDDPASSTRHIEKSTRHKRAEGDHVSEKCFVDYVGEYGWAASRTSHRNSPHADDAYIYGADDGSGVDIYILDTGIYTWHTDFDSRARFGMKGDSLVNEPDDDLNGHGTHVAGVAAGKVFGIARSANIISCKVLGADGWGEWSDVIQALEWVVGEVQKSRSEGQVKRSVINLSLAGEEDAYAVLAAIQAAIDEGIVVTVAAGNHGLDSCSYTPARLASAITVGATDLNDTLVFFSNYGPCVNLLAPGLDVAGPGIAHVTEYVAMSGTSSASPLVAGMAARILSVVQDEDLPSYTPAVVKATILDRATRDNILLEGLERGSTPNRLLYMDCHPMEIVVPAEVTTTTTPVPTTTTTTTSRPPLVIPTCPPAPIDVWSNDDIYGILIGIIVVVTCLMVFHIGVICGAYKIYKCSKKSQSQQCGAAVTEKKYGVPTGDKGGPPTTMTKDSKDANAFDNSAYSSAADMEDVKVKL